jgi:hypothetical protein
MSKDKSKNGALQHVVHVAEHDGFESVYWILSQFGGHSFNPMHLFTKAFDVLTGIATELKSEVIAKVRDCRLIAENLSLLPTDFSSVSDDKDVLVRGLSWLLSGLRGSKKDAISFCEVQSLNCVSNMCLMLDNNIPKISRGDVFLISLALEIPVVCLQDDSLVLGGVFTFQFDQERKLTIISSKQNIKTRKICSPSIATVYSTLNVSREFVPGDGSCLFSSIALSTHHTEDTLRGKLSSEIGLQQLECYRQESKAFGAAPRPRSSRQRRSASDIGVGIAEEEYPEFVMETGLKLTTVESLKIAARTKASDGIHKCLWGDEFALHVLSNFLEITFLLVDLTPGNN